MNNRDEQIKQLHTALDTFLSTIHDLNTRGGLVSPTDDTWRALHDIFGKILELKFRPDCDRWLPVRYDFTDIARHRRPYFKPMPRGLLETSDKWDAALETVLHNVNIAVKEYQQLQREKLEAPGANDGS